MADDPELTPAAGDVLVVTQKVVSKAEGSIVDLRTVSPRPEAVAFAERWDRDPRQVEVVLREAAAIVRMERGVLITRTRHGFVCANGGVDASNVAPDTVTLLPADPDGSARSDPIAAGGAAGPRARARAGDRHQRLLRPTLALGHHRRGPRRGRLRPARRPARPTGHRRAGDALDDRGRGRRDRLCRRAGLGQDERATGRPRPRCHAPRWRWLDPWRRGHATGERPVSLTSATVATHCRGRSPTAAEAAPWHTTPDAADGLTAAGHRLARMIGRIPPGSIFLGVLG